MTAAIATQGLVKRFGGTLALDGLDLEVRKGEIHGFLGPNGAGKTTTLRALLGLLRVDSGTATVLGRDPWRDAVALHRELAYVPGDVSLWPELTGGETVDLLMRMRGADPARSRRDELVERFRLDPTRKARTYSTGNRRKVVLVAALADDVPLLLLDEPTAGLDPLMESVFRECLREAADGGRTVLLSSHLLDEVQQLCHRVSIVRAGRVVESGTLADLDRLRRTRVRAEVTRDPAQLARRAGVHDAETERTPDGWSLTATVDREDLSGVTAALADLGLRTLTSGPPSLEELFLDAYREEARTS